MINVGNIKNMLGLKDVLLDKRGYSTDGFDINYDSEYSSYALSGYFVLQLKTIPLFEKLGYKQDYMITPNVISIGLPQYNITTTEIPHAFGQRSQIPIELSNATSTNLTLYENSKGSIHNFFTEWARHIMDETTGLPIYSIVNDLSDNEIIYRTDMMVYVFPPYLPDNYSEVFEYSPIAIKFINVFPTTIDYSSFNTNIESVDLILVNMTMMFDMIKIYFPSIESNDDIINLVKFVYMNTKAVEPDVDWITYEAAEAALTAIYTLFGKYVL